MQSLLTRAAVIAAVGLFGLQTALPQDDADVQLTAEEEQAIAAMQALWDSLDRQSGNITLGDNLVTLRVPDDYYFLGSADAQRVLVEAWGNPPAEPPLGMLFPTKYTPFDADSWAVTIEYIDDGHVSDFDAADIDYDDLLTGMKADIRDSNPERIEAGYEPIELIGWAEPPRYDPASRKLYWAKELRFGEIPDTTLNYDIRAFGRTGILSMTFIAGTHQLAEINDSREAVLAMAEFNPGKRYEDFDSNIDEIAAYGIGALIAGKVAAKAGLFAVALVFLKKFGVLLVIGLGAVAGKAKKLFSKAAT
jgi:uncharacterized membrane-anchored protein